MAKMYVCLGTDQAVITEEEYNNGLTVCGGENCTFKGHPFVEGGTCEVCGKNFAATDPHDHSQNP